MDRSRYELTLACTWLLRNPYADFFVEAEQRGIPPVLLRQRSPFDPSPIVIARRTIRERGIGLIQTHGYKPGFIGYVLSKLTGLPWLVFVHGDTAENRKVKLYNSLNMWLTHRADRVVTVSKAIRDQLVAQGVGQEMITVVHNAIDPSDFDPGEERSDLRLRFGMAPSDQVITVIGRFSPEKGQLDFVEAFSRLAQERPLLKALLVGEGQDAAALKNRCRELGLVDRVIFTGYQQNVAPFYGASDLIVLPSLSEGLPNVALEALLHRRPIVATRVGGTPEVVIDGETGILVPPADPAALAEAIGRMLDDPELQERFADNGSRLIQEEYSPKAKAARIAEVYDEVLTGRKVTSKQP
jgi:glycosyltransferase involved in cell wall biosynthesis